MRDNPPDFKSGALTTRPAALFLAQKRVKSMSNFQYIKVSLCLGMKCIQVSQFFYLGNAIESGGDEKFVHAFIPFCMSYKLHSR
jgi:hypothetical protein